MPKMIDSRFVTGPNDDLAVVDIYEVEENAVRNRAEAFLDDLSELLGGLRLEFEELFPEIDLGDIAETIQNILNAVKSLLSGLAPNLQAMISEGEDSRLTINLSDFPLLWDLGTGQLLSPDHKHQGFIEEVSVFLRQRQRLTGRPVEEDTSLNNGEGPVSNLMAQQLVYSRIVEELIKRELSSAIPSFMDTITNDSVKEGVALSTLPIALNPYEQPDPVDQPLPNADPTLTSPGNASNTITAPRWDSDENPLIGQIGVRPGGSTNGNGDLNGTRPDRLKDPSVKRREEQNRDRDDSRTPVSNNLIGRPIQTGSEFTNDLEAIRHLLANTNIKVVLARYPMLIRDILKGVVTPRNTEMRPYFDYLLETLEMIDQQWLYRERDGEYVTNLNIVRYASHAARTLFILFGEQDVRAAFIIGFRYRFETNEDLLRQQYPFAIF